MTKPLGRQFESDRWGRHSRLPCSLNSSLCRADGISASKVWGDPSYSRTGEEFWHPADFRARFFTALRMTVLRVHQAFEPTGNVPPPIEKPVKSNLVNHQPDAPAGVILGRSLAGASGHAWPVVGRHPAGRMQHVARAAAPLRSQRREEAIRKQAEADSFPDAKQAGL